MIKYIGDGERVKLKESLKISIPPPPYLDSQKRILFFLILISYYIIISG